MIKIVYPDHAYKIKTVEGKDMIFDELRRRWVRLTPEEWVRQNILQYFIQVKHYPSALIAVEKELYLGELKKRFDILVYDAAHLPWLMVECKAMEVPINEQVLHQVLRYNLSVPVTYLVLTNGQSVYCFHRGSAGLSETEGLPDFGII